jgi:hypothetical protein
VCLHVGLIWKREVSRVRLNVDDTALRWRSKSVWLGHMCLDVRLFGEGGVPDVRFDIGDTGLHRRTCG